MRRHLLPLILLLAMLLGACAKKEQASPLEPFHGTWRIDFEHSYRFVLENQDTLGVDSLQFRGYLSQMSKVHELVITDSIMSLQRGRHYQAFPYRIVKAEDGVVTVDTDSLANNYQLEFRFDEDGLLHMRSTRPEFREMFLYRRAMPGETLVVQSPLSAGNR